MKKVMGMLLAVALVAGFCVRADEAPAGRTDGFYAGTVVIPAGTTNVYVENIRVCPENGPVAFRALDEFTIKNTTGTGTGTVTLLKTDVGVDTLIMSAGSHVPGYSTISYPRRTAEVQSIAGWVVTNDVIVAKTTVVSDYAPYNVRRLKINIAQPASATSNVYWYSIKAK